MPLDLNDVDVKKEFDTQLDAKLTEKLKELGYDEPAKETLKRRDSLLREAQAKLKEHEGTAKEKADLEKRVKELQDADADRKKKEDEARKKVDDEKKTVEERLAAKISEIEDSFGKKLTALQQQAVQKQQEYLDDLKARDSKILMQAVRSEAREAGIIDPELVALLNVSDIKIEKGEPDRAKIAELVAEHKKAKPHLYDAKNAGDSDERKRDENGRFIRPEDDKKKTGPDFSKMSAAEFEAAEERLRSARA